MPTAPPRRNAPLHTEYLATTALKPIPGAPRLHPKSQIRALTKSYQTFGQVLPILIDGDNRIISGLALWEVLRRLGRPEAMVIRVDYLSEAQVKALMVALNRIGDLSKWDEAALRTILLDLHQLDLDFDIEATGFTEIELMIQDLDVAGAGGEAPVLVGDSPVITRLGDDLAAIIVTDPPYNVPIDGHVSGQGKFKHREFAAAVGEMSEAEFKGFLRQVMQLAYQWSKAGSVHCWAMDWRHVVEIASAGKEVYERYLNMAVWVKDRPGMGSYLRSQHELFFIFAKGGAPSRNNVQLGRFGRSRSNVWTYPSAASLARTAEEGNPLAMHPTVKPLALIADILLDASVRGDVVADPFGGSGTTLIAAEKLGRKARLIELDPAYCDTIVRRWQRWTGEQALRLADGMTFDALEAEVQGEVK